MSVILGGWAVGCCPHGIVYAIKSLLRAESPRDYIDLERSLKHRSNICVADIAHLIATHGKKTLHGFYHPHGGRIAEATEENMVIANAGNASFELPCL